MLLKDLYSPAFFQEFSGVMSRLVPGFESAVFQARIFDGQWEDRELKDRMKHTSSTLHHFLPQPFEKAAEAILSAVSLLQEEGVTDKALEYMFLPDYIERYGLEHYQVSVKAMEELTAFTSCEFAVRPFIKKYSGQMLDQMLRWAGHSNPHVRRLASEGCRPRLPWAMALSELKKDPSPILPILEKLKADPSEYVRRSVANNLNDISKGQPGLALSLFQEWIGKNPETDWVVKHGCRTLLKQGNPEAMALFGYSDAETIEIHNFQVQTPSVPRGSELSFSFELANHSEEAALIRLEYGMYFLRANGSHSKKVFKISEREYPAGSTALIEHRQSFRAITTRRYYPGAQEVSIIVNGKERAKGTFVLE